MRVTIFGSGGFLGRRLVRDLTEAGHEVQGVSSSTSQGIDRGSGLLPPEYELPPRTEGVIYLAQSPHYRQMPELSWHVWNVNVTSALRVGRLAQKAGVRRFLYASTGSVYAPSFEPLAESAPVRRDRWYPLSKLHAEESLSLLHGEMEVCSVRPFGIYGPGQRGMLVPNLLETIAAGREVTLEPSASRGEDGGLHMSLCYVDDAARIVAQLLNAERLPRVVNLAGPTGVSIRMLAEGLATRLGVSPRFRGSDRQRETDLLADLTLLEQHAAPRFTELSVGLDASVAAWQADRPVVQAA